MRNGSTLPHECRHDRRARDDRLGGINESSGSIRPAIDKVIPRLPERKRNAGAVNRG